MTRLAAAQRRDTEQEARASSDLQNNHQFVTVTAQQEPNLLRVRSTRPNPPIPTAKSDFETKKQANNTLPRSAHQIATRAALAAVSEANHSNQQPPTAALPHHQTPSPNPGQGSEEQQLHPEMPVNSLQLEINLVLFHPVSSTVSQEQSEREESSLDDRLLHPGVSKTTQTEVRQSPKPEEKYPAWRLGAAQHRAHELLSSAGVPDAAPGTRSLPPDSGPSSAAVLRSRNRWVW